MQNTEKKSFLKFFFSSEKLNDFSFQKCSHPSFIKVLAMSIYQQTIVVLILIQQVTFFEKLHSSSFYIYMIHLLLRILNECILHT